MKNLNPISLAGDHGAPGDRWRAILRRITDEDFAAAFCPDVVLETAVFDGKVVGTAALRIFFNATSTLYEAIHFVRETSSPDHITLEWKGIAFSGMEVCGVTILDHNANGAITHVSLFHRPYAMVQAFGSALGSALNGRLGPEVRWPFANPV